jgi:hypothetical protein
MAIAYVGSGSAFVSGDSSKSITLPGGISAGNIILVFAGGWLAGAGSPSVSGYTSVDMMTASTDGFYGCWYKIATGSETTVSVSNGGMWGSLAALVFSGVDTGSPIVAHDKAAWSGTDHATVTSPSVSNTTSGSAAVFAGVFYNGAAGSTTSTPGGMTSAVVAGNGTSTGSAAWAFYKLNASTGAQTYSTTASGGQTNWYGGDGLLFLKPASNTPNPDTPTAAATANQASGGLGFSVGAPTAVASAGDATRGIPVIEYVGESHSAGFGTTAAASVTINKPTGVLDGDLMIALIGGNPSGGPAGWTSVASASVASPMGPVNLYWKIASSEGSSYTFSFSSTWWSKAATIIAYRNVDQVRPVGDVTMQALGAVDTFPSGSITCTDGQWNVSFATQYNSSGTGTKSWSASSGTQRVDFKGSNSSLGANAGTCWYDSAGTVTAGTYSRTHTLTSTSTRGAAGILAINPPGTAVGTDPLTASAVAYDAEVRQMNVGGPDAVAAAYQAQAGIGTLPDAAEADTAIGGAFRAITADYAVATSAAGQVNPSPGALAHEATASASANDVGAYYGAATVRVFEIPEETRIAQVLREERIFEVS